MPLTEIEIAVSPGFDEADALALADTDAPGLPVWLVELGDGDDDGLLEPESPLRDTEPHALSTSAAAQVVTATRRKRTASSFPRTSGFRAYVASPHWPRPLSVRPAIADHRRDTNVRATMGVPIP